MSAKLKTVIEYAIRTDPVEELNGKYWVHGSSQMTPPAKELLDQWLTRMVLAGDEHACEFYGWGSLATLK